VCVFGVAVWVSGNCGRAGEEFLVEWGVWKVRKLSRSYRFSRK
jgi:hypothetical protein